MSKTVKMADIAEMMNVSVVTVSKALSGQKGVSEEVREKIIKLADEMGYKQPSALRLARSRKSYNIGVLVSDRFLDKYKSFYWEMYQEVAQRALQKDCFTMLEVLGIDEEKSLALPKLLQEEKVEGMIVIGLLSDDYLEMLSNVVKTPLVYLDFYDKRHECDAIITDNYYGMYKLTNYLFDMGHTQIAYVGTLLYTGSITDRYFGYAKSMLEHGQKTREDWIVDDRDPVTGRTDTGFELVLPEKMPTAFVCNCDLSASQLIKKLKEKGYRVPEDISVVGFDNYLYPGLCDVEITTYEVDMKEMARKSINNLLRKISGEYYKQGITIVEGHIVLKDSVRRKK
ncbi:MAG: LacI family transcriptional regulator [Clostridiales bacterium]|nr:LacI family transcriptional regulator [Clostridiales bacterium]